MVCTFHLYTPCTQQSFNVTIQCTRACKSLSSLCSYPSSCSIIGLYLSVVLVISRLIRNAISSLPSELLLDEIVNPNPLLKLCKDIFTVRESKDFKLEEILVGKLFSILRSPERLIELTENAAKKKQD